MQMACEYGSRLAVFESSSLLSKSSTCTCTCKEFSSCRHAFHANPSSIFPHFRRFMAILSHACQQRDYLVSWFRPDPSRPPGHHTHVIVPNPLLAVFIHLSNIPSKWKKELSTANRCNVLRHRAQPQWMNGFHSRNRSRTPSADLHSRNVA